MPEGGESESSSEAGLGMKPTANEEQDARIWAGVSGVTPEEKEKSRQVSTFLDTAAPSPPDEPEEAGLVFRDIANSSSAED